MSNYVICTTQRSGSTLFSKTISNVNVLGKPSEKLLYLEQSFGSMSNANKEYSKLPLDAALKKIKVDQSTNNGVFGIKIMWSTMNLIIASSEGSLSPQGGYRTLIKNWGDTKFIFWRRRDKIKQAVSHAVMRKVGQAHAYNALELKKLSAEILNSSIGCHDIEIELYRLFEHEMRWKQFFLINKIDVKVLYFEDFLANKEGTIREFPRFIDVNVTVPKLAEETPLLKISNEETARLEKTFRDYLPSVMSKEQLSLYDCQNEY
jgi:LPS sulfotransferase NodH